jgi:hypothetical protein
MKVRQFNLNNVHFTDKDCHFVNPCVHAVLFSSAPTPDLLAKILKTALNDMGLTLQLIKSVMTNSELTLAAGTAMFPGIPMVTCFVGKLETLKENLWKCPEVAALVQKIKTFDETVAACEKKSEAFRSACQELNIPYDENFLPNVDNGIRLQNFFKVKAIINELLCTADFADLPVIVNHSDFATCEELLFIYHAIRLTKEGVDADKEFCTAQVCPQLDILSKKLAKKTFKKDTAITARKLLQETIDRWLKRRMSLDEFSLPQFLDPRTKTTLYLNDPLGYSKTLKKVKELLKNKITATQVSVEDSVEEDEDEDDISVLQNFSLTKFINQSGTNRVNQLTKYEVEEQHLLAFTRDLSLIEAVDNEGHFVNVKKYWDERKSAEPFLSILASNLLSMPGKRQITLSKLVHSQLWSSDLRYLEESIFLASLSDSQWKV